MNKQHGPWTITDHETKYKNPWIEVNEDKVIRPDGKPGIFGTITMCAGVSILPIDEEFNVYLTEEFHYAIGSTSIETVSGAIDKNEKPEKAAIRELKEELGIDASELIDLGVVNPFTTVIKSPANLFLAKKLIFLKSQQESTEIIRMKKVKLQEAVTMVMESKITHGPSCVLILKTQEFFKKHTHD